MQPTVSPETEKQLSGTVLIVDDNAINRFLVNKLLVKWGLTTDFAENGQIALDKIKINSYDVVLMDIQMPVMNGLEATIMIRKTIGKPWKDLPVIALTASVLQSDLDDIARVGMNDYISKPFVPAELYGKLAHVLGKSG